MSRVLDEVRSQMSGELRPGLVAVSGGSDSVAMLRAFKEVVAVPFTVVHVNHQLRGDESDGDEAFVVELAKKLGVPIRVQSLPIPDGASVEVTARNLRYEWFREIASELDCGWLATGHTADDRAETVLHRIIRGTGLAGLSGIQSPGTIVPGLSVLRPLLEIRRTDLLDFLCSLDQPFRTDTSNADPRFTRNRIRHEVMPLLRTMNPNVDEALVRLAEMAAESLEVIEGEATSLLARMERPRAGDTIVLEPGRVVPSLDEDGVHPQLLREMFRLLWKRESWPAGEMSHWLWDRVAAIAAGFETARDFPGGVSVRRVGKVVQLGRNHKNEKGEMKNAK